MKTEMHMINLLSPKREIPEKKESEFSMKRENVASCKTDNYRDNAASGSDRNREVKNASFKETYETVNSAGQADYNSQKEANKISAGHENGKSVNKKQSAEELVKNENLAASNTVQKQEIYTDKMTSEQAKKIMLEALTAVSQKLNLTINNSKGLEELDFNLLSDAVVEQFSEILYALKGISQLLENAVSNNVALEVKGMVIEPDQAEIVEKSLRIELFRMQMALKTLGIAGDVSRAVGVKMNTPVNSGILQATDPSSLSMPDSQLQQLLGNLIENEGDHITSVIEHITALANAQKSEPALGKKAGDKRINSLLKEEDKGLSLRVTGSYSKNGVNTVKPADLCAFDPQVIRRLLKIDGSVQKISTEGHSAEKPYVLNLVSNTAMSSYDNFQQKLNVSLGMIEQVTAIEASEKGEGQAVDVSARLFAMPLKSLEETVMIQVTQKMNQALKSGMHEMRLVLRPESLGDMRMTIQMDGDIVMARITVENQQVKQIIESNLQALRDSLEEQNLQAGAFDVNVNKGSQNEERQSLASERDVRALGNVEELADEPIVTHLTGGTETGRRFGSNTIEYFA